METRAHRSETREALAEPLLLGESAAFEAASRETRAAAHTAFVAQCSRFEFACGGDEDAASTPSGWNALLAAVAELPVEQLASDWSALVAGGEGTQLLSTNGDVRLQWWTHWLFERVGPQLVLHSSEDLRRTAADLVTVLQHVHRPSSADSDSANASVPAIRAALRRLALATENAE